MGALYRENATGFLVEYGSNPGAGYTAISAMPTDTIDNEVAWHRALDTYGQTSAWHPSLPNAAEDPSPLALAISLSNSAHLVSADATGTVTDSYAGANTTISIYRGSTDVFASEGWSLSVAPTNCTVSVSGATVAVTAMTASTAYVEVTASRTGSPSLVSTFSLAKAIKGATGATGSIWINGANGTRGSSQIVVSGAAWSDSAAWSGIVSQTGTNPVLTDMVTISNGSFTQSKFYAGGGNGSTTFGTWVVVSKYIDGNLLVAGTIGADKIAAGTITADKIVANTITTTKLDNNATHKAATNGGSASFSGASAGSATIGNVSVTCYAPSYGRSASGYNSIVVNLSGTAYGVDSATSPRAYTIYIYRTDTVTLLPGSTTIYMLTGGNKSADGSYGVDFSLTTVDKNVGPYDNPTYNIYVYCNVSGGSSSSYTFTYGISASDLYK